MPDDKKCELCMTNVRECACGRQAPAVIRMVRAMWGLVAGFFSGSVFSRQFRGKFRRFWTSRCRPGYVRRMHALRRGECSQCGICCALGYCCPALNTTRRCSIYTTGFRPKSCEQFPVDAHDIQDVTDCGGKCGFWFAPDTVGTAAATMAEKPEK